MEQTVTLPCVDGEDRTVPVLSVDEVIALEQRIAKEGTSLYELMQRAGASLAQVIQDHLEGAASIAVLAGSGNNGGDGWVAAQILADAGHHITIISKTAPNALTAEPARTAAIEAASQSSFDIIIDPNEGSLQGIFQSADLIVDAILGTGFAHSEVRSPYGEWIELANSARTGQSIPVISADCPSGLNAQTGEAVSQCISADTTVTMLAPKCGLLEPEANPYVGKLLLAPLIKE